MELRFRMVAPLGGFVTPFVPSFTQVIPQGTVFPQGLTQIREVQTRAADFFACWYDRYPRADRNSLRQLPKDLNVGAPACSAMETP